ncbi:photosystem I assembly protein Ycf3 [Acaryochloris sp. IP29b_bin.148]|uniref:photosystem I assembly protein Ycf3 n=1 Tax=Acaryochloris sp. IP29b_bin.148 TaxID=2969218 RepID=UPI0026333BBA|nr:photosystem I assembly protein Ycf3 [Acaryochloris sp. IP29b_bin.148]
MPSDNFIDKAFSAMSDVVMKVIPTDQKSKDAFKYYRSGMAAQVDGNYAKALGNYTEALALEEDPFDKSYILYNMGLIFANNGDHDKALDYYHQSLELNPNLVQALYNTGVILHFKGEQAEEANELDEAERFFDLAADFWKRAIKIAPNNYSEVQNWLKTTGRVGVG